MQNKTLLIISLTLSILGIILLLAISLTTKPEQVKIKQINKNTINQKIQVNAKIDSVKNFQDFQLINVHDNTGKITIFNNNKQNLTKNQNIIVIGKIQEYKNELEIIAIKINVLNLKMS